jgi:hypothetical protein
MDRFGRFFCLVVAIFLSAAKQLDAPAAHLMLEGNAPYPLLANKERVQPD